MEKKEWNWGIVGTGVIANEMAASFQKAKRKIYAVTSRNAQTRAEFVQTYGVQTNSESWESFLQDPALDIVYIATPHNTHYTQIKEALFAGKHVIAEKAITVNATQLAECQALAAEKGLVLMEAMTIFHMPLYKKLAEEIKAGLLGNIKVIQVNFGSHKEYDLTNRFFNKDLAGGALLDIGGYATSFARYFMESKPTQVLTTVNLFETGVDEQSAIIYKNQAGQMASLTLSMQAKQPKRGVVSGDKGYLEIENFPRANRATFVETATGERREIVEGETADALWYEVLDMEAAICSGQEPTQTLTSDVMNALDDVRQTWGLRYPFE